MAIYDEFLTDELELNDGFKHAIRTIVSIGKGMYAIVNNGIVGKPVSFDQLTKTTSAEELYADTDEVATDIKCWGNVDSLTCTISNESAEYLRNDIMSLEGLRPLSRSERRSKGSKYEASRYKRKRNNVKEYF